MIKDSINISKIETYLNSIIDNVVSKNTFFAALPDASIVKSSDWQDMVLIDIPSGIKDFDAYGQGIVFVALYARPLESGRKNVAKMSQMETKLNEVIRNATSGNYSIMRNDVYSDYDMDIKWHCNIVELLITIV